MKSRGRPSAAIVQAYVNLASSADRSRAVTLALLAVCVLANIPLRWPGADYRVFVLTSIFAVGLLATWLQGRFVANGLTPWAVGWGIVALASIAAPALASGGYYYGAGLAIPLAIAAIFVICRYGP